MPRTSLPTIGSGPAGPGITYPEDFGVELSFKGRNAIVAVRGDLDALTVPTLRAMLDGLVDGGHQRIVLELDAVTFMGAEGLGTITRTIARLRSAEGVLVLRSIPARITRLLEITGLAGRVAVETVAVETVDELNLRAQLARSAAGPARNRAVDAQLSLVVAVADATIGCADGVSVTLNRAGRLGTVAASNDTVLRMDAHQYATGEGPCLSAADEGRTFHSESLEDEARWPAFVPLAADEGIASILSTPLIAGSESIGALNIYSNTPAVFGTYQHELAAVLADQASAILTSAADEMSDAETSARITAALRSRLKLAQAQGVLMTRQRVSEDEASDTLHRMARAAGISVLEQATALIASTHTGDGPVGGLGDG